MGRKAGLTLSDVVDAAQAIADGEGLDMATLSAVARQLGVKTPSLYNHVDGAEGLRRQLALLGARILHDSIASAIEGRSGPDALRAAAVANRDFAAEHPGLYAAFLPAPTEHDDPVLFAALAEPVWALTAVLVDMGVGTDATIHLIRALRAMLHGFLDLEAAGGFGIPVEVDVSFDAAVELVIAGIVTQTDTGG